jgi:hypothetical protein
MLRGIKLFFKGFILFIIDIIFYSHKKEPAFSTIELEQNVEILLNDLLVGHGKQYGPQPAYRVWIKTEKFTFSHQEAESFDDIDEQHSSVTLRTQIPYDTYKDVGTSFLNSGNKRYYGKTIHSRKPRSMPKAITLLCLAVGGISAFLGNLDKIIELFKKYSN